MHSAVCGDRTDVAAQQGEQTGSDVEQIFRLDIPHPRPDSKGMNEIGGLSSVFIIFSRMVKILMVINFLI